MAATMKADATVRRTAPAAAGIGRPLAAARYRGQGRFPGRRAHGRSSDGWWFGDGRHATWSKLIDPATASGTRSAGAAAKLWCASRRWTPTVTPSPANGTTTNVV
jgi:hypothetical protein